MTPSMCADPVGDNPVDNPSGRPSSHEDYDGWMNKFCFEPPGDVDTCCLAFWVPCVLYGKIDERLERLKHGKDPNNVGNGFNPSCLIWSIAGCGFCGGMTGNRRTRVRGVYDINGELCDDCVTSCFCNMCVLMQTDREIRAREGQIDLRTSPGYKNTTPIDVQPGAKNPMRYVSPRETASSNGPDATLSHQIMPHGSSLENGQIRGEVAGSRHSKKVTKSSLQTKQNQVDQKKSKTVRQSDENKAPRRQKGQQHRKQKADQRNKSSKITGTLCSSENTRTEMTNLAEGESGSKDLSGLVKHNTGEEESPTATGMSAGKSHAVVDCAETDIDVETTRKKVEHLLVDCDTLGIVEEHECAESSAHPTQELSYVHDFTDCPVDKNVLEYYEQAAEEAQNHVQVPEEGAETNSNGSTWEEVPQHLLQDCPQYVSFNDPVATEIPQHELGECDESSSATVRVPGAPPQQHGLVDCHRESFASTSSGRDHTVKDYRRSSSAPLCKKLKQHDLASCTRASSFAVPVSQSAPVERPDCCRVESGLVVEPFQHDLSDCPRNDSTGQAAINPEHDESGSNGHAESPSLLQNAVTEEHDLTNCPRASNASLQSTNPYLSHAHELEDCDTSQDNAGSSQSSGPEQLIETGKEKQRAGNQLKVRKRSKKNNKGKQRAEKEHTHLICQPCEHVTFKAAEGQNSKLVYAAVIHDNLTRKTAEGKAKIANNDGGRSSRPSRVRGTSAQNALEKVLADSEIRRKDHSQVYAEGHFFRRGSLGSQGPGEALSMEKARENRPQIARRHSSIGDVVIGGMTGLTGKGKN